MPFINQDKAELHLVHDWHFLYNHDLYCMFTAVFVTLCATLQLIREGECKMLCVFLYIYVCVCLFVMHLIYGYSTGGMLQGQYHCLSDLTVYGALMNWYCAVICFRQDIVNHMDIPQYASSCRANEDMYDFGVVNFLPIIKAHLRVYTRLAFSVAYNIVSYDKVLQNDNTMYVYTAGILWKVVMSIIEKSLQFFEDICHVMIQFLEGNSNFTIIVFLDKFLL